MAKPKRVFWVSEKVGEQWQEAEITVAVSPEAAIRNVHWRRYGKSPMETHLYSARRPLDSRPQSPRPRQPLLFPDLYARPY